jgi:hypothetical protein
MRPKAGVVRGSRCPTAAVYAVWHENQGVMRFTQEFVGFAVVFGFVWGVFGQTRRDFGYSELDFGQTKLDLEYPEIDLRYPEIDSG